MALLRYNLHPHLSSLSTLTKMSARTFAGGLIHGTILASTGVNIPAVPLSVLQAMEQTDTASTLF